MKKIRYTIAAALLFISFSLIAQKRPKPKEVKRQIRKQNEIIKKQASSREPATYNLAQLYADIDSTEKAISLYHKILPAKNLKTGSKVNNQLGFYYQANGYIKEALSSFRSALELDPSNEVARFNYELLLKKLPPVNPEAESPEKNPSDPKADPSQQGNNTQPDPNPPKPQKDKDFDKWLSRLLGPQPGTENRPAQPISDTLSLAEAMRLLQEMESQEIQYLQQLRRRAVQNRPNTDKPDW